MTKDHKETHTPRDSHYARLRRTHRDTKAAQAAQDPGNAPKKFKGPLDPDSSVLLYGLHAVRAAIDNSNRNIRHMRVTKNAISRLEIADPQTLPFDVEVVTPQAIDKMLPADAIHQGVVIDAAPLPAQPIEMLKDSPLVLILDRITDPHNVGAIMRSAVAFGAGALITTMRHSPQESGVLAKSASGALEMIPYIQVTNLADAITALNDLGFATIGLDSEGPERLEDSLAGDRIALVLGAEGKGLRQKTRETVKSLARLDMPGAIKSLNVSNAAAISLYAARKSLQN
jgi:23S rRNA (guanosine2251-2'-O)-methyltransferase